MRKFLFFMKKTVIDAKIFSQPIKIKGKQGAVHLV